MFATITAFDQSPFEPLSIDYHKTMAGLGSVGRSLRLDNSQLLVAEDFHSLSNDFKTFVSDLNELKAAPKEEVFNMAETLIHLSRGIDEVVELSSAKGLLSNGLTASSVGLIAALNLDLRDVIDRFKLSLDPELKIKVSQALREFEAGESVSFDSVAE